MLSLDLFGKPAADLPVGVTDYATSVRSTRRPDLAGTPCRGPRWTAGRWPRSSQAPEASAAAQGFTRGDRVMSMAGWTTADELTDNLLAVFAAGASLVQVAKR